MAMVSYHLSHRAVSSPQGGNIPGAGLVASTVCRLAVLLAAVWLLGVRPVGAAAPVTPRADIPALIDSIRIPGPMSFCGEAVAMDDAEVRERMDKEMLLMLWDRAQVILWLKRATRYMPVIESALSQQALPDDLKYIPIIESALRPHAGSSKGAVGYWQFLRSTGRRYGLRIDRYVDERRHIVFSTTAAIAYLKDLKARFGSWTLAAAAYNMGEKGLEREIETQKHNDYYRLYLPLETQRYLFRIFAVKLLLTDPDRYGFHLTGDDLYPPVAVTPIPVKCRQRVPLTMVAEAARLDFKRVKDLNPHIRGYDLVKGRTTVFVPKAVAGTFPDRFAQLQKAWYRKHHPKVYVVRKGDSLSAIANRFGVPLSSLLLWNRIKEADQIHPGDRINLFP
jgi:membrane-bound lytic murein transglycosylase D